MNNSRITLLALTIALVLPLLPPAILAQQKAGTRPKVGLVLSGGGAKGIAHVGVLKVLEEAGVKVDYIAGTSMGSIVGGFYAIGYDAKSLEKFALEEPWDELLSDEMSLRNIPIEEKNDESKYILSFALKGFGFELPKGVIKGQKLMTRLSILTLPYHQVQDFNKLPIPFRCVATDIETGEAVVFDRGFLPKALRASMSIPSALTPVEIDGRLLVDGGVVRNFPVSDVRAMGADIVIGVDVGAPLYKKEEITSLAEILEQSISFLNDISTKQERKKCDILILPDIRGLGVTDFAKAKDIIKRGEDAARSVYPQLKKLAERLKQYPDYDR
ncbi:MAG: patatin-like phospholipase family protein, partial [Spirochaetes bacterium]|nr:patatin-like phospholipase family protein [Spirochaetota bacterium]